MCRRKTSWLPRGNQTRPPRAEYVSGAFLRLFETHPRWPLTSGRFSQRR